MKNSKTILHIIDTTGPGGAETVFIELLSHLPKDKYRSLVVIRGKGWVFDELKCRGFNPILLDAKGSFNWRYLKSLYQLIRREKVDLIQSHLLGSNVYCSLAGLLTGTPVVATFHGMVDVGTTERFSGLKFAAINYGASAIVAVSTDLKNNIVSRSALRADKTGVIYNGIDTAAFAGDKKNRIRQQFGWGEQDIIIGSLGNIRPAKAYDVLLQAAAILVEKDSRFKFVIAGQGSGKLFQKMKTLQEELSLQDNVQFLGFNDDPAEYLNNLDLFVLSSSSEGFSIATIQAMAAGLPVIATRSGGPQEILSDRENGLLVAPNQVNEIAAAITELASDESLRQQLAEAGQKHAIATFDIQRMIKAYEATYEDVCS